ncbi:MAG: myo-inositol-phosphate synthase, partial [Miltoncostaeaceae bacterium]|nr:myo-inositol-phosphate synthase [Miltoncostaeaceae bacterium]
GISGTLEGPSSYFMKSPPVQHPDALAHELTEAFIRGEGGAVELDGEVEVTVEVTSA